MTTTAQTVTAAMKSHAALNIVPISRKKMPARLCLLLLSVLATGAVHAQTTIYEENFQNRPGSTPIVRVNGYTGVTGVTYTADAPWLTGCNGWISRWNQPTTAANGAAAQIADCNFGGVGGPGSWNATQQLAQALGMLNGQTQVQARENFAVSAYTAGDPGANFIEVESSQIALPGVPAGGTGRFVTFAVDVAATACPPVANAPLLQFYLVNPAGTQTAAGGQVNGCTSPTNVTTEAVGVNGPINVRVGHYSAPGALLYSSGTTLAVRVRNAQASGVGNDHAFDNLAILDVSPQLSKTFASPVLAGQPTTLTFTVTNTPDLLRKQGWAFVDQLVPGLVIATPNNLATTCTGTTINAPAGGNTITVTAGNLPANAASCTISLNVFSPTPGNYTNGAANVTSSTALNIPNTPATVEVVTNQFTLQKLTREGVGTFAMSGNNGIANQSLTTTSPGTPAAGAVQTLTAASASVDTTVSEVLPADWLLRNATCTGLAAGVTPTFTAAGAVTIPFAGLAPQSGGRNVVCTLENLLGADLSITKQNADPSGGTVVYGATTRYTITVSNAGPGTSTNAIVRDTPSAGLTCAAGNPVTCTGPVGACPAGGTVGDLTGAGGLALGVLAVGASVNLQFNCIAQ